jgi:hypothetical protein
METPLGRKFQNGFYSKFQLHWRKFVQKGLVIGAIIDLSGTEHPRYLQDDLPPGVEYHKLRTETQSVPSEELVDHFIRLVDDCIAKFQEQKIILVHNGL